ncbi:MAG: DUF362 domain-containing protein [Vulcanimicrobiota bacterium]
MNRREMLRKLAMAGVAIAGMEMVPDNQLSRLVSRVNAAPAKSTVAVAQKKTVNQTVKTAIDRLGGITEFIKKGARVVIKPNAAWAMTPEQAANTNPEVIDTLIGLCKSAGAGRITLYEHPCENYKICFQKSGIMDVCRKQKVDFFPAREHLYRDIGLPMGKTLKRANVIGPVLDADCYINVPVVKVHGSATVTLAMKNQMGCVKDRGYFHRHGLHQCIADMASAVRPTLNVIDATRALLTGGPKGPGKVKQIGRIIASTDIVAADAYTCTLLGYKPGDIGHIKIGYEMGLGEMDLGKINIMQT